MGTHFHFVQCGECSKTKRFFLVAGAGVEPTPRGYEPREVPFLYPAFESVYKNQGEGNPRKTP